MTRSSRGFTLIEVMITVAIMGVLSLLTYQTIRTTSVNRGKMQSLLKNETKLSDALRVMEHDVSRAFHYRNIHFEILKASREAMAKAQRPPAPQPNQDGNQPPPPPVPPAPNVVPEEPLVEPPNYSGFEGDATSLYLTTLSNYRTLANSPQSDQLTVGYTVESCPNRAGVNTTMSSRCLMRTYKHFLERDLEEGGKKDVVVENVQSLTFRYFGDGQDDWTDRWVSTEGGEEFSRGRFPLAVEIALSLYTAEPGEGQTEAPTLQRTIIVPLRFPNNPAGQTPQRSGVRDVPL